MKKTDDNLRIELLDDLRKVLAARTQHVADLTKTLAEVAREAREEIARLRALANESIAAHAQCLSDLRGKECELSAVTARMERAEARVAEWVDTHEVGGRHA
jgi:predicted RecB family endonuclease